MKISQSPATLITGSPGGRPLIVNQLVSGKVLGHLQSGELMLNLEGHRYRASMRGLAQLPPGQEAVFRVSQTVPRIELSVVQIRSMVETTAPHPPGFNAGLPAGYVLDPGTALLSLLANGNFNAGPAITPLLQALVRRIRDRVLPAGALAGLVRQRFLHSGLFFEGLTTPPGSQTIDSRYHPLQDLKLLLYLLSREAGIISSNFNTLVSGDINKAYKLHYLGQYSGNTAAGSGPWPHDSQGLLAGLAQENLERVMGYQVKSLDAHRAGEAEWHFDLQACVFPEQLSIPVTIRREEPGTSRHEKGQREIWRVTFTVESRKLGLVKADIRVRPGHVEAGIGVANRQITSLLDSRMPFLAGKFAAAGLKLSLTIHELQPDPGSGDND